MARLGKPEGETSIARTAAALFAAALLLAGCGSGSSAKITEMVPGISAYKDKLECWVTVVFQKPPAEGDPQDVTVRFTGKALEEGSESFEWAFIAEHDVTPRGEMQGYEKNETTSPGEDPPIGMPIKVDYPLHGLQEVHLEQDETLELTAEVYWAGKLMDKKTKTIEHAYQRKHE